MGETRRGLPEWARFALSLVFLFVVAIATAGLGTPFFLAIMLSAAAAIAALQLLFPVGRLELAGKSFSRYRLAMLLKPPV